MMKGRHSYLKQLQNTFTKLGKLDGIEDKNAKSKVKSTSRILQLLNSNSDEQKVKQPQNNELLEINSSDQDSEPRGVLEGQIDLKLLEQYNSTFFSNENTVVPFDDQSKERSVEKFSTKSLILETESCM